FKFEIVEYQWIAVALVLGAILGIPLGLVPMTAVPQRTALSHAFGALAAGVVGTAEYYLRKPDLDATTMIALGLEVVLGFLTFTGSLIAAGKLQGIVRDRPWIYRGQNIVNLAVFASALTMVGLLVADPGRAVLFPIIIAVSLDGSSGFVLSIIMCRAMNRSFTNVLFGGFGAEETVGAIEQRPVRTVDPEETAFLLDMARTVVIIPGYGMAAAQAQHKVRELTDALLRRGVDVKFAIHPVAGRMPGH